MELIFMLLFDGKTFTEFHHEMADRAPAGGCYTQSDILTSFTFSCVSHTPATYGHPI